MMVDSDSDEQETSTSTSLYRVEHYAILSHRWEGSEVTFDDIKTGNAHLKQGYRKIELCCEQAIQDQKWEYIWGNHDQRIYVWIDTCCIDKSSSSELSEAINSMYDWYHGASRCYAYLSDVFNEDMSQFEESLWFTRGWTLQELLAPKQVYFYDHDWNFLGQRIDLSNVISRITGVSLAAFTGTFIPQHYSAAEKMSWAANRQTTREEDIAYCLIGIFQVNMPLIYGEGKRAFLRLQEEILKQTQDLSLFVWESNLDYRKLSIFAQSPLAFEKASTEYSTFKIPSQLYHRVGHDAGLLLHNISGDYTVMTLYLVPCAPGFYFVPLAYKISLKGKFDQLVGAIISRVPSNRQHFVRYLVGGDCLLNAPKHWRSAGQFKRVSIVNTFGDYYPWKKFHEDKLVIKLQNIQVQDDYNSRFVSVRSRKTSLGYSDRLSVGEMAFGIAGIVQIAVPGQAVIFLVFGTDFDFNLFFLAIHPDMQPNEQLGENRPVVTLPDLREKAWMIEDEDDMIALMTALKPNGARRPNLKKDRVEMHVSSSNTPDSEFLVTNVGSVQVRKMSYDYDNYRVDIQAFTPAYLSVKGQKGLDQDERVVEWYTQDWKDVTRT